MLDKILNQKAFISFALFLMVLGGVYSYMGMGKLEDAEIPIKAAKVVCLYPGASAEEVEMEVTDKLEKAIQKLGNIDEVESRSIPGMSDITINLDWGKVSTSELPQYWDNLRKKIADISGELPPGAYAPVVYDDFGEVYGIFLGISGDGYNYEELHEYAKHIKKELLLVKGVKRIELIGERTETIDILFSREKFAQLGINPMLIVQLLNDQSMPVNPGSVVVGSERLRLNIGNKFQKPDEIRNMIVQVPDGGNFRLGDIAEVKRGYKEPRTSGMKVNGYNAFGLAIAATSGVNIITVGEAVDKRIAGLKQNLPVGIEFNTIFHQSDRVKSAISNFMNNLIQSIVIVIGVLLVSMGLRTGLLIASGLVITILGTFIVMKGMDIQLQRISLAAIIIAMGMLVDNSIVVADGILVNLKRKIKGNKAFTQPAKITAMPLLGATLVAILAFLPLVLMPGGAGEFLRSLFYVIAISLFISWLLAMVQTPFMARFFYSGKKQKKKDQNDDPYAGSFYRKFRSFVTYALLHKTVFIIATIVVLLISFWAFRYVNKLFFPNLAYNQFFIEYRLPQGSDIEEVAKDIDDIQKELATWPELNEIVTSLGSTPTRYTLVRPMNTYSSNYGEIIINTDDYETALAMSKKTGEYIREHYPEAQIRARNYNPINSEYLIEAQFSGPDKKVLRALAEEAKSIMREHDGVTNVTDNWKNQTKVLMPVYDDNQAKELFISREDLSKSLAIATNGLPVGQFYDKNESLLLMLKLKDPLSSDLSQTSVLPVWGQSASVPLSKLTDSISLQWEDQQIMRYNNKRAIMAQCDPLPGFNAPDVLAGFKDEVEAIKLPPGYELKWMGEHKQNTEANNNLMTYFPLAIMLMILIVIGLFNNFRQPVIVFAVVPLAFIGVIAGMLITGNPFGFTSLIGSLGLIGMMIKNSIVLLDQINIDLKAGKNRLQATIDAAVSRFRPVLMASLTTVLGMSPLLFDDMFGSMATAIMFGLLVGSVITLVIVPVLYAILYRIDTSKLRQKS